MFCKYSLRSPLKFHRERLRCFQSIRVVTEACLQPWISEKNETCSVINPDLRQYFSRDPRNTGEESRSLTCNVLEFYLHKAFCRCLAILIFYKIKSPNLLRILKRSLGVKLMLLLSLDTTLSLLPKYVCSQNLYL